MLREALAEIREEDRIVVDTGDGRAVVLLGAPGPALDLCLAMHAHSQAGPLQSGLHHGPVMRSGSEPEIRLIGNGLVGAGCAARASAPGSPLASEDFVNALRATAPQRAAAFEPAGEYANEDLRLRLFQSVDPARRQASRRRLMGRRLAIAGAIAGVAILAGVGWRLLRSSPAVLTLDVKPRGEIFVDGVSRGQIPPLTEVEILPGDHVVEIRSPGFVPLELRLKLQAGERMTISHTFGQEQGSGFWRNLKRKLRGQ